MKKNFVICLVLVLALGASAVSAQKTASPGPAVSVAPGAPTGGSAEDGIPDSLVTVDFSGVNSWDLFGSPNNELVTELLGSGAIVTGAGYNVTIETVGASWLNEVVIDLSGNGGNLSFRPGFADGFPGTGTYDSGGIVDFTDIPGGLNSPAFPDGSFPMEVFEDPVDDIPDAIDATFLSGSTFDLAFIAGAPVPTLPTAAMLVLVVMLLALAAWFLRRRTSEA